MLTLKSLVSRHAPVSFRCCRSTVSCVDRIVYKYELPWSTLNKLLIQYKKRHKRFPVTICLALLFCVNCGIFLIKPLFIFSLTNFTVPYLSYLAIIMLFGAMMVLYVIPLRYLLMAWGINKFTRKILRPHTIPNNEVLDLLSRVPDDETLLDCRELKPHPLNENRRDARKKHKPS